MNYTNLALNNPALRGLIGAIKFRYMTVVGN